MNLKIINDQCLPNHSLLDRVLLNARDQFNKDAKLANCSLLIDIVPKSFEEFIDVLHKKIHDEKGNVPNLRSFNYTLDLAEATLPEDVCSREYSELIVQRIVLKVWFRINLAGQL